MATETTSTPAGEAGHNPAAPRTMTLEAPDLDHGRSEAAKELGVPAGEVQLRVVSRKKKGFLGMGGEILQLEATWTPPPPAISGRIELACDMGKVSLAVFRPEGHGKPADQSTLDAVLADWPLDARDETVIGPSLRSADGKPRLFGTMAPSAVPPEGSPAAVKVAPDDLTAWLMPWKEGPADAETIRAALVGAGVTAGIDEDKVTAAAGTRLAAPVVIARGRSPQDGVDAVPEFALEDLAGEAGPAIRPDGSVDFRDLGGIPLVSTGDVLVRKVPAVQAIDGATVRGKKLPAKKPKDFDLRKLAGQNTGLSEDRLALVAKAGGLASRVGDKVAVMPMYAVEGDVDFKTGNLDFEGNITVTGGVKSGFKLHATGAIQIGGTVEGAQVEAGGAITVLGGVVGQHDCVIRAGGPVAARFIQGSEIHATGPVTVGSEIRDSTIVSEASVTVAGAGRIVGGLVRGKDFVEAGILGSPSGSLTTVQAGWGEEMEVEIGPKTRIAKVVARSEINGGVVITVSGATQRISRGSAGGVYREKDHKLEYSAS